MKSVVQRSGLTCLALIAFYFAVPIEATPGHEADLATRIGISVLALIALLYGIRRQLLRHLAQPQGPLGGLVVGVVAGTLLFALIDYAIAVHLPGEFVGLRTRLDALYFQLTTLFTVGFGDITAQGQFARGVMCVQMLLNVTILATVASYIVREAGMRAGAQRR